MASTARTPTIATTIISSMSVNPSSDVFGRFGIARLFPPPTYIVALSGGVKSIIFGAWTVRVVGATSAVGPAIVAFELAIGAFKPAIAAVVVAIPAFAAAIAASGAYRPAFFFATFFFAEDFGPAAVNTPTRAATAALFARRFTAA